MNPTAHNAGIGATESRPVPGRNIEPIRSLRAHVLLALLTLVVVTAAGFPVAWKKGKRTYAAQAVVYVSPRFLKNMEDDKEFELQSNSQYREFVQQNVRTIDRYDIVEEAVGRLEKQGHPWQRSKESLDQAVNRLQSELKILPVPDTYQITVRLEGEQPDGLAEIVNTVVDVFLEKSKDEDFYGRDQRLASLEQEGRGLEADIASLGGRKDKIAQELAVSVFSESFSNPFDQLLVGSKEALASARQKRIVSEAQLDSLKHTALPELQTGLQAYAGEMARRDADITSLQSNLNFRRSELLAKLDGMLPNHPGRKEIEAELQHIDQVAQSKREDLESTYASILLAQRQAEAAADARAEREIQKQVELQAAQAVWYSHNYQTGINIRYEIERARNRLQAVENRIDFVEQEGRAPGFARLFSPARPPFEPVSGGRKKPMLILLFLAAALSFAAPVGLDYVDPRLLSPNEVEKALGFAPMGFTHAIGRGNDLNGRVQRLAVAIERDAERNASHSFVFVPVNAAAQVSETVAELADVLANLGHAVEVVGVDQPQAQAAAAGAGRSMAAPFSVPGYGVLGSVRNRLRETAQRGAIVLICAKPFSVDPETELLASAGDVVLLTLQCGHTKKSELQSAMRTLENIAPRAVAAVVTGYDPNPPMPEVKLGLRKSWAATWSLIRRGRVGEKHNA